MSSPTPMLFFLEWTISSLPKILFAFGSVVSCCGFVYVVLTLTVTDLTTSWLLGRPQNSKRLSLSFSLPSIFSVFLLLPPRGEHHWCDMNYGTKSLFLLARSRPLGIILVHCPVFYPPRSTLGEGLECVCRDRDTAHVWWRLSLRQGMERQCVRF